MASILIGDAVVSVLVKLVLEKLVSPAFSEIGQIFKVKGKLNRLKNTLSVINDVLLDAEEQESTNNSVRNWLLNLRAVVYDIEDLLDLISTQNLESKVKRKKLRRIITNLFSRYRFAQELKTIQGKLDEIAENRRDYSLHNNRAIPQVGGIAEQRETCSAVLSHTYGREQEKEWIISHLLNGLHDTQDLPVIPISGIGGMGKTTLAQLVFNDPRVAHKFDLRLWAYVSKKFVIHAILAKIIDSATGEDCSNSSLETLHKKVHGILDRKTFLLVLDDVWIEDIKQWLDFKNLLTTGSSSGLIIVTTRGDKVAAVTGTVEPYKLKDLPEDHCWSIFVKHAFGEREEDKYPLLVNIGRSIVRKCGGVPLAVKTLGSLLRDKRDADTWNRIAKSKLLEVDQKENDILPVLKLSLDQTPFQLRACFAFCSFFGKGYPFYRAEIINLWRALGFLHVQEGREDVLDVGNRYFDEFLSMSFLQLPSVQAYNYMQQMANLQPLSYEDVISQKFTSFEGKITCTEMHDVVHDLATLVAGKEIAVVSSNVREISEKVKHIAWDAEDMSGKDFPNCLLKARKARSFAILHPIGSISKSFLKRLLSNFKCLRILMLLYSDFEELPESVGNLKHLRYLKVYRNSQLKLLPDSICKLVNLQVLHVKYSFCLEALPKDVQNLVSLRALVLTSKIPCLLEKYLKGWSSLEVLKMNTCPNLASLSEGFGHLTRLRRLLIRACPELTSLPNNMRNLTNLEQITIQNCEKLDLTGWTGLQFLTGLKYLFISGLPKLLDFPDGIDSAAGSLQYFRIDDCADLRSLPDGLKQCTSLLKLEVFNCPKLRCRCEIGGDYWHLISHVPEIYIDKTAIQTRHPMTLQGHAGSSS